MSSENTDKKRVISGTKPDPSKPDFWESHYRKNNTPWDAGGVPQRLMEHLSKADEHGNVLIPGCGKGHEASYLASEGWHVTAVDFSPSAVLRAREMLGNLPGEVIQADFLSFDSGAQKFDCVYERAFLCSLPPALRSRYAQQCADLLRPGGMLFGFFFVDEGEGGPPFPIAATELRSLLRPHFGLVQDEQVSDSLDVFRGNERWQIWVKS